MFYQCPQCKKVWQFPINKCAECFVDVAPMPSTSVKVIEVCQSTIPTLVHPKVPYYILLLEDENGNKWAHKSIKKYNIGDAFELDKLQDKNSVIIWLNKYDINETLEKINQMLGNIDVADKKILVLPTLITADHPYLRVNTFPETLDGLIKFLTAKGASAENITVGAQSFSELSVEDMAKKSLIGQTCKNNNVALVDLAKNKFVAKGDIEISQLVYDNNLIINLPIMKMGEVAATRNLACLISKDSLFETVRMKGEEGLMKEAIKELPEILTIADAIEARDTNQISRYLGLVMSGYNPLNIDRIFYEITGQKYPPPILSAINVDAIPLVGRQIIEVKYKPVY